MGGTPSGESGQAGARDLPPCPLSPLGCALDCVRKVVHREEETVYNRCSCEGTEQLHNG